ncbi:hypothetical protein DFH09DRAFT_1077899 [Mycena vulgaris]|nr:hypothetical protein DFH09DRAFT_1077899 [Mycena vulgaris]
MLGTSVIRGRLLSTNAMPPYRPLAPSSSSSEGGEGDMDQEWEAQARFGTTSLDDKGGGGREYTGPHGAALMRHAREEFDSDGDDDGEQTFMHPQHLPEHLNHSSPSSSAKPAVRSREIGCTSKPLLEMRTALEAAAFLQSVVPRPLDPAPPEDEHPAARILPRSG